MLALKITAVVAMLVVAASAESVGRLREGRAGHTGSGTGSAADPAPTDPAPAAAAVTTAADTTSVAPATTAPNPGQAGCPCISVARQQQSLSNYITNGVLTDYRGVTYDSNFGTGSCQPWELKLPPYCADANGIPLPNAPEWCGQSWCYVRRGSALRQRAHHAPLSFAPAPHPR